MSSIVTTLGLIGFVTGIFAVYWYLGEHQMLKNYVQQQNMWNKYLTWKKKQEIKKQNEN